VRIFGLFFVSYILTISLLVLGQMATGSQEDRYKAQGTADAQSSAQKEAGELVGEAVSAMRTVASFNMERRFVHQLGVRAADDRAKQTGARMYLGILAMAGGMAFVMLTMALAFYYGFWLIENDPSSFIGASGGGCAREHNPADGCRAGCHAQSHTADFTPTPRVHTCTRRWLSSACALRPVQHDQHRPSDGADHDDDPRHDRHGQQRRAPHRHQRRRQCRARPLHACRPAVEPRPFR
jgi:hypothetical protein